jgi:hypothetical protein
VLGFRGFVNNVVSINIEGFEYFSNPNMKVGLKKKNPVYMK